MASASLSWAGVGDTVEVKWSDDRWYVAEVKDARTHRARREIYVHYRNSNKRYDEWVRQPSRVRPDADAVEFDLENDQKTYGHTTGHQVHDGEVVYTMRHIHKSREKRTGTEYLVEWEGEYEDDQYTWEPRAHIIDEDMIDDFERREKAMRRRKKMKPLRTPIREPYVTRVATVAGASEEVATQRAADAAWFERAMARAMKTARDKQKDGGKGVHVVFSSDVDEPLYMALHTRLRAMATRLGLDESVVTEIRSKHGSDGGDRIVDYFRINDAEIVEELLGMYNTGASASGCVFLKSKKMAIGLVGPITVEFETTRDDADARVRAWGYFSALKDAPGGMRWVQAARSDVVVHAQKMAVARGVRGLSHPPPKMLRHLNTEAGLQLQ